MATFTSDGLVCRSLSAVLETAVCPANHYLAGFDTGAGVDSSNGNLICRPEAEGSGGGAITLPACTESNRYISGITNGIPTCAPFGSGLTQYGSCPAGYYAVGFRGAGGQDLISDEIVCSNSTDSSLPKTCTDWGVWTLSYLGSSRFVEKVPESEIDLSTICSNTAMNLYRVCTRCTGGGCPAEEWKVIRTGTKDCTATRYASDRVYCRCNRDKRGHYTVGTPGTWYFRQGGGTLSDGTWLDSDTIRWGGGDHTITRGERCSPCDR